MIDIKHPQDLARIRRIALFAQGLLQVKPFGVGIAGAQKAIAHIGYVQIDTISVVERAHHHVMFSRVPNFKPATMNNMLLNGDIFEYWTHAAAFLPINDFRFSLPFKHAIKSGQTRWYKNPDQKLMGELITRIRLDGPLRSADLDGNTSKRKGWWDWKPAKKALEQLYMQGDLMVSIREGFQKSYDISERVLPSYLDVTMPSTEELATHLLDQQLRCHGLVSLKGVTYLRRDSALRTAVKNLVGERVAAGLLEQVQVGDGKHFLIEAGALERPLPRLNNRLMILSPFDNSVIQRERLRNLFNYNYQIECYMPEAKRQYGYFSLPLLYRDEFIGRIDCKAHRKTKHLEIRSLYIEKPHLEQDKFIAAFSMAIKKFLNFQQCESISLVKASPKKLTQPLRKVLLALA